LKIATVLVTALLAATSAFAQTAPPNVGGKPLVQVKPKVPKPPSGCTLVGTVKGTKLWAGDCHASELRVSEPAETDQQSLSDKAVGAIPPGPNISGPK
jgi:hypothetical protein